MTRRNFRFQDELPVLLSLATALAILVSAAAAMWVWSMASENMAMGTIENRVDIP